MQFFDFSISDKVHKQWCRFIIHRYLGHLLERKLTTDQLSIQLSSGKVNLFQVDLNVEFINETLSALNLPLRLIDGYVGQITIEVPWLNITADATQVIVKELQLTFRAVDHINVNDSDLVSSMIGSVVESLVSSLDLAQSFYNEEHKMKDNEFTETEGVHAFAKVIEAVVSRFCISMTDTTIRLESTAAPGTNMCTAIEMRIDSCEFMDEQMRACMRDGRSSEAITTQPQGLNSAMNLNKFLTFKGLAFFTDTFSTIDNIMDNSCSNQVVTSMYMRREKNKLKAEEGSGQDATSMHSMLSSMAYQSCYSSLGASETPLFSSTFKPMQADPPLFSSPIKFAELSEEVVVTLRIRNTDLMDVHDANTNRVEVEVKSKGLNVFLTPSQIVILKNFFTNMSIPPTKQCRRDTGKQMNDEHFDIVVRKQLEEQSHAQTHNIVEGNWSAADNFRAFDTINLDNSLDKNSRSESTVTYGSQKTEVIKKETVIMTINLGCLCVYIAHDDYLSVDNALSQPHAAIDKLLSESDRFFANCKKFSFMAAMNLATLRQAADNVFPHNHLRLIGAAVKIHYAVERSGLDDKLQTKITIQNCDALESLKPETCPGASERVYCPILDFTRNEDDMNTHITFEVCNDSINKNQTKITLTVAKCTTEVDVSIVDRIANLLVPKPFFLQPIQKLHVTGAGSEDLHLNEDLFMTADMEKVTHETLFVLDCEKWTLNLRVPVVDLRGEIATYDLRKVHPEILQFVLKDANLSLPLNGSESKNITLGASSILGNFLGDCEKLNCTTEDLSFLFADKLKGNGETQPVQINISYDPRNKSLKSISRSTTAASETMTRSMSTPVMQNLPKREGPFAQTHQAYPNNEHSEDEHDQIIRAGSRQEMVDWADGCMSISDVVFSINLPILRLNIPGHAFLEIIYNRLVNDLALWEPRSPNLTKSSSDLARVDCFKACKDELKADESDEEPEVEQAHVPTVPKIDKNKGHSFSLQLQSNKCTVLMETQVTQNGRERDKGQVSLELGSAELFVVTGYHSDPMQTFLYFTTNKASLAHRNTPGVYSNVRQSDFGFRQKEYVVQIERCNESSIIDCNNDEDCISVAMHLNMREETNVKDVLFAISLRQLIGYIRPFRDIGHHWAKQLADLFTLQDFEIPGYELPQTATDFHLHLDQLVVAYDHVHVNPESPLKLRAVIGQADVSSCIISSLEMLKFVCIFEKTKLFLTNQSRKEGVKFEQNRQTVRKPYVQMLDIGLFQLELLYSQMMEHMRGPANAPWVEYRCKNDLIKAWACADSLVTLINLISEVANSDCWSPIQEEEDAPEENQIDDTQSEVSAFSRTTSLKRETSTLSPNVAKKLQQMVESAIQESPTSTNFCLGIPVGKEAADEFDDHSLAKNSPIDLLADAVAECNRDEAYHKRSVSLSTDDEFCMVDDVLGAGVTGALGEPRIRTCGSKASRDDTGVTIDPQHFPIPDDVRTDGFAALPDSFPQPLIRHLIKDLSISLTLFAGNDLGSEPGAPKTYSAEEYREGRGKGQSVSDEEIGGPHRDHSVSIELQLNKINYLYQLFNKDAPMMCMTLASIHDITIKDLLKLSDINEMMYQYWTMDQPRRTCAPMLAVRMVESHSGEGKLRMSLLPIRLNVDQDTLEFLEDFISEISTAINLPEGTSLIQAGNGPVIEVAATTDADRARARLYPSLSDVPLTPSPVAPSPLGDLSFFENKGGSPVRRPPALLPTLTDSVVSMRALFDEERTSRFEEHCDISMSNESNLASVERPSRLTPDRDVFSCNEPEQLTGDWASSSEIKLSNLTEIEQPTSPSVDDLLMRSTMQGSVHPDLRGIDMQEESDDQRTTCGDDDTMTNSVVQNESPVRSTTFFKEFVFAPSTAIYIDYQGKQKMNMERGGAVIGVLKGLGKLTRTEIVLKEINCKDGLLGLNRCVNHAVGEWQEDVMANIPNVLASCGPISPIVQFGKGVYDLLWMPVSEMRKDDGHVVKGIQKGAGSFGVSTAAAFVDIAQTVVGAVQYAAETVFNEVNPRDPYLNNRNRRPVGQRNTAPTDLRHATQMAYEIMRDGVQQTRDDLQLATQESRASGQSTFRTMLRFATPAMLRPIVMSTQVTYQMLGGLKNQIKPDEYKEDVHKWKEAPPGSSR